jgi:hypothetical protein
MAPRKTEERIREVGRVREDQWERFDRLQRNLRPFYGENRNGRRLSGFVLTPI